MSKKECPVCTNPYYHSEIDQALLAGHSYEDVAGAFYPPLTQFFTSKEQLLNFITRHAVEKHTKALQKTEVKLPAAPEPSAVLKQKDHPITIEGWAQKLLEMGFEPEILKKLKPSDIVAAQRLLIEKEKLKLQNDSLKLAMLKFMSGLSDESDLQVIQGEEA